MGEACGIASWTVAALALALLVRWLPPWRPGSLLAPLLAGVLGAWAGGALATALGFGGLAGFDPRSLSTAALCALFALLLLPLWRTRAAAGRSGDPAPPPASATAQRTRRS